MVAGNVVDGFIKKGMSLLYPYNGDYLSLKIIGVEFLDVNIIDRVACPALVLEGTLIKSHGIQDNKNWVGNTYDCV